MKAFNSSVSVAAKLGPLGAFILWFGAAVSVAEMYTGGLYAGTDRLTAYSSLLVGHAVGAFLMFFAAKLSWKKDKAAMESLTDGFGILGAGLAASLNVLQLLGWSVVMILGAAGSFAFLAGALGVEADSARFQTAVRLGIGGLLILWVLLEARGIRRFNQIAVVLLFGLTLFAAWFLFGGTPGSGADSGPSAAQSLSGVATAFAPLSFASGFELGLVMPLSWLPLVGDYSRSSTAKKSVPLASALGYFLGSSWMYAIGLQSQTVSGNADPSVLLLGLGFGLAAFFIVLFSTLTTAYLDVISAAQSLRLLLPKQSTRRLSLAVGVGALLLALVFPLDQYQNFLLLIGSVFAPLFGVYFTDAALRKRDRAGDRGGPAAVGDRARDGAPSGGNNPRETPVQSPGADTVRLAGRTGGLVPGAALRIAAWFGGLVAYHVLFPEDFFLGKSLSALLFSALGLLVLTGLSGLAHKRGGLSKNETFSKIPTIEKKE